MSHDLLEILTYYVIVGALLVGAPGIFFFQAEDGIRDRSPSRGLGDVYKRQIPVRLGSYCRAFPEAYEMVMSP